MRFIHDGAAASVTVIAAFASIACGSSTDSTAPRDQAARGPAQVAVVPTSMIARTALNQAGWAGYALPGPTVQVFDQNGRPMANVSVTFKITQGGGSISTSTAVTTDDGYAGAGWTLGEQGGLNIVEASTAGISSVSFSATAKVPVIVASYNLQDIGGKQLPVYYSGGGYTWAITGGHFVIAADNTFAFGYDVNGTGRVSPTGSIVRVDASTVLFFLSPIPASNFYMERDGLFATGHVDGNTMTVKYEDFIDFELEKYVLSPPP